ncbi:hypothetical protein CCB80_10885 [Armatimonadetes bacterium Uphvl-Ar1]|nr:hypothetical protein CCB80_10885 [Armatimonadetes bacterium Uphvl-Ar1]
MKNLLWTALIGCFALVALVGCNQGDEAPKSGSAEVAKDLEGDSGAAAEARGQEKAAASGMDPNDPTQRGSR